MGLFDQFPYTNFHELNLDWILKALKENGKIRTEGKAYKVKDGDCLLFRFNV